jgi:hypothetical protein
MSFSLLNATGCPPSCGGPVVRVLTAGLGFADIPSDHSYLACDNIKTWVLQYDMESIPWSRNWFATFSNETETEPDTQGLGSTGVGLPNSTYLTDPEIPTGSCLYGFQRVQVLFTVPTNYLLICVGWQDGYYGYYDQACAGTYGNVCGVMEIPWSVIPGFPYVWLFLQGAYNSHAEIFTDLCNLVANVYGWPCPASLCPGAPFTDCPYQPGTQPNTANFNPAQICGFPVDCNDPFGQQFTADP